MAQGQQVSVEHGDIGETGHPLGLSGKARKIEAIDNAGGAVAAPRAENGPDSRVVKLPLKVAAAQVVVARKLVVVAGNGFAQHYLKAPGGENFNGGGQLGGADFAGGADQGHALAALQGGGELNEHKRE